MKDTLITIAIRSLEQAQKLAEKLELAGIKTQLNDVDERHEKIGVGVRVRIDENDLPDALKIIENVDSQPQTTATDEKRHMLVPIDFSDYSMRACEVAFNIAYALGNCELVLLHAYIVPKSFVTIAGHRAVVAADKENMRHFMARLEGDMKNLTQKIRQRIAGTKLANIKFSITTVDGVPEESIINYCEKHTPLLIVMGTRGKDKKEEDLIGSVTAEVIEHATVPVLAIPEDSDLQILNNNAPKKILFATNFDDRTLISFRRMMELLKGLNISLLIAHFEDKHDDWNAIKLAGLKDFCRQNYPNMQTECVIVSGKQNPLDAFDALVSEHHIDVIALNTHKRRLFASLFNPSIARKMVFHARTPILVFHS